MYRRIIIETIQIFFMLFLLILLQNQQMVSDLFLFQLSPEVDYECWPYTEKRYTKRAKKLAIGETVIAIGKLPVKIHFLR